MDFLINLLAKSQGLNKVLGAVNGYKTYTGGCIEILTGAATALGGAANILQEIVPLQSAADYYHFAQNLSHDPAAALIAGGIVAIGHGLTAIGLRHGQAKAAAAIAAAPAAQAAAPAVSPAPDSARVAGPALPPQPVVPAPAPTAPAPGGSAAPGGPK